MLTGHSNASANSNIIGKTVNKNSTVQNTVEVSQNNQLITGNVDKAKKNNENQETEQKENKSKDPEISSGPEFRPTKSEFAILQSLAQRRKKLDEREKQLVLQRNLLKAAEKRLNARLTELKSLEQRVDKDVRKQKENESAQYSKLIQMYSKMKPADAARIFNRLDLDVLVGLVNGMKAKAMSSILSAMDPAKAERLTLKIANQGQKASLGTKSLPKIKNNN